MYSDEYIVISGMVTGDPKMGKANETDVCTFPMAIRTGKRDEAGVFKTDYFKVSTFGANTMKYVMEQIVAGTRVRVSGFQTLDAFIDKNGEPKAVAYVTAADIKIDARPKPKTEGEPHDE